MAELEDILVASIWEAMPSSPQISWSMCVWSPACDFCWDWGGGSISQNHHSLMGTFICLLPPSRTVMTRNMASALISTRINHSQWALRDFVDSLRFGAMERVTSFHIWFWTISWIQFSNFASPIHFLITSSHLDCSEKSDSWPFILWSSFTLLCNQFQRCVVEPMSILDIQRILQMGSALWKVIIVTDWYGYFLFSL